MKKINNKGFTLVELLLVIAIIGILAAVLFVSLGSQRERARITAFKEQMRSMVPSITTCVDSAGVLLDAGDGTVVCEDSTGTDLPIHGYYLDDDARIDCDGDGTYAVVADNTAGAENLEGTCTTSDTTSDCVATCDMQGCSFVGCD